MNTHILFDPLGNEIHLPSQFQSMMAARDCIDEKLSDVIEKPAMIIKRPDPVSLYHFRAVDWGVSVLIMTTRQNEKWVVSDCIWDPDPAFVTKLISGENVVTFLT